MSTPIFVCLELGLIVLAFFLIRRVLRTKIEIPGVKELVAERDLYKAAFPDLLNACELFEKWMLCGQPGPYSDSQILSIVRHAIAKAKGTQPT